MDVSVNDVENLASTTFSGRRFTRNQIREIQSTVNTFQNLSRSELARTIYEHFNWKTPKGQYKINSALGLLKQFEEKSLAIPPTSQGAKTRRSQKIELTSRSDDKSPIISTLEDAGSIKLVPVSESDDMHFWNELVSRHHPPVSGMLSHRKSE